MDEEKTEKEQKLDIENNKQDKVLKTTDKQEENSQKKEEKKEIKIENKEKITEDIELKQKRKKIINFIKNFFTAEVDEEQPQKEEEIETKEKTEEKSKETKQQEHKKQDTESQQERDLELDRKKLVNFTKKNPKIFLYACCVLVFLLGLILYKFNTQNVFLLNNFIPFPLNFYGFLTFFIIIPIISLVLIYFKKYVYIGLLYVINSGFAMRIQNLGLLKDSTTQKYLPLALDPHVFLRYSKYILEYGKLFTVDTLRFFPVGADMSRETVLLPKFIVYLYKFLHFFSPSMTLELADVLYPPICFAVSLVFFFLIIKNLFNKKVALLATFILILIPSYIYRTTAGFSDKESLGLMLMFIAFYFFIIGWESKKTWKTVVFGLVSGLTTGLMGLTWGGVNFTLLIFAGFTIIQIFLKKFTKNDFYLYCSWIIPMTYLMGMTTIKFGGLFGLVKSFTSGIAYIVLLIGIVNYFLFELNIFKIKSKIQNKFPLGITSTLISLIIAIISAIIFIGPSFVFDKINGIFSDMINPFGKTRWALTVAESHQPYFTNWISDFGWAYILFFFIGAIILFYYTIKPLFDEKKINVYSILYSIAYALFLIFFTMSRYRREGQWNGETDISKALYIGSFIGFVLLIGLSYLYLFYYNKHQFNKIQLINRKYIFIIIWFIIMLVAARSALRLILMLAPITSILVAYFIISAISKTKEFSSITEYKVYKWLSIVILIFILIIAFWPFGSVVNSIPVVDKIPIINLGHSFLSTNGFVIEYASRSINQVKYTGPSYDQQWQLAGQWIRENTPEDAVFAHWWDYGYWVQTGGERTTVTDGGNWIGYWNHLMGRHALMAETQTEALEFLNMHNVTHFLVITDEVGKIGAYSSIGSDENYDRYTFIPTLGLNNQLTQETRDGMIFIYEGTAPVDEDFEYNGVEYFSRQSAIKDVFLPVKKLEVTTTDGQKRTDMQILQPYTYLFKDGVQPVQVPLNCLYYQNQLIKFDNGLNHCFMVIPSITNQGVDPNGAGLYLGEDSVNALWVNLFLLEQKDKDYPTDHFKLALNQQHPALESITQQTGINFNVAVYNGRLLGPLKIWEVSYPDDLEEKPEYLFRNYQEANLTKVTVI